MVRPVRIHDQDILDAARRVFLNKGIQATTAEVAASAGISEGSLFKRYKSKDELFAAALQTQCVVPTFLATLEGMEHGDNVFETLVQTGCEALQFFRQVIPMMMMSWSHTTGCPAQAGAAADMPPPPMQVLQRAVELLAREVERGRLNPDADPLVVAMGYFGAIKNYAFFQVLYGEPFAGREEPEVYVRDLLTTLWHGIGPKQSLNPKTPQPRKRKHHA